MGPAGSSVASSRRDFALTSHHAEQDARGTSFLSSARPFTTVEWGGTNTREVWINEKIITPAEFVRDLKAVGREPGDNWDIIQECRGVRRIVGAILARQRIV
jgi:hypothetical protein